MGRFRTAPVEENQDSGIDISPLLDCVFILLIFFIVTTTFVEETGVEVDRPIATTAEKLQKNSILLALTAGGEVVYGGRVISMTEVRALVRRLLQKESLPVVIQADEASRHELLVQLVEHAKLGGAVKVSVATRMGRS